MNRNRYVIKSLELHLFFCRIMKEHALFLRAGFTPAAADFSKKAEFYLTEFENLLRDAVALADGVARKKVLSSGEAVTEYTALAEKQTERLTGIPIDGGITEQTACLRPRERRSDLSAMEGKVRRLNRTALKLLDGLIGFKEKILDCVARGELFTMNYPLLIEHILREAKLYRRYVQTLEREGDLPEVLLREDERFWNRIMMEHAQFIAGLLDPGETELLEKSDDFALEFWKLLEDSRHAHERTLAKTTEFRDFKAAGTEGIQKCRIRSVILPLLADHVLREANHYIRLLEQ